VGHLDETVHVVHGADGVADGHLGVGAFPLDDLGGPAHVAHVVQGVKDAKDVDAVLVGLDHETVQDVVGVMFVADDVLAAQQHLERGVGHVGLELTNPLPGVLVEKAHGRVKGSTTPHLDRPIANMVQFGGDGHRFGADHVVGAHARGQ